MIHHPVTSGKGFVFALVRDRDIALISRFSWTMEDGNAVASLYDIYGLRVTMDYLIANPCITVGSHGTN